MALISKASLLMVPSTYEPGTLFNVLPSGNRAPDSTDQNSGYDQTRADFDFDRGSNAAATRIGSDGLLKKYRENLLVNSNSLSSSGWTTSNASLTSGQSDKDGGTDAWKLTASGTFAFVRQLGLSVNGVTTASVYLKAGSTNWVNFRLSASANNQIYVNLSNGTFGTISASNLVDKSIEDVGDGWYRVSVVLNVSSLTGFYIYVADGDNTLNTTNETIFIQSAQLESGLVATEVLTSGATTGKAGVLVDLPRINYDANGENGSLLLEPSRQNKIQYSEYFGGWGQISTINTANALTSPEGLQNANKLIAASGVNNNVINQQISAGTYTASVFAKKGEFEGLFIGSGPTGAFFNLNTYTYRTHYQSAPTSYKIEDYGNGWHRYSITFTISGNDSLYIGPNDNVSNTLGVTGNNSNGIYIYGAQLESSASYPSSYIPNHGESGGVTRAADSCNGGGNAESINSTEGVLFVETKGENDNTFNYISLNDGGTANYAGILYTDVDNEIAYRYYVGGSGVQIIVSNVAVTNYNKIAVKWKANDFAIWVNGIEVGTASSGSLNPSGTFNELAFARGGSNNTPFYGNVKQVAVFNEALSDSELATLTTL